MKQALLFFGLLLLFIPGQGAVEVYSPVEALMIEQVTTADQKTDKEIKRALRKELKKARKLARAEKEKNPNVLAILGFIFALGSFLFLFRGVVGIIGVGLGLLNGAFFLGGLILSIIALVWIKDGKIEKRLKWMPITALVLTGLQVLLAILAIVFLALLF